MRIAIAIRRFAAVIMLTAVGCRVSSGRQLEIRPTGRIATIEQGLGLAAAGDTLLVQPGTYTESGLLVSKTITIVGVGFPTVDAHQAGEAMTITAPEVVIKGLVISGVPVSFTHENAGVYLDGADDCVIEGNRFPGDFFAIYLAKSHGCLIKDNVIAGTAATLAQAGNGIHLWYCHDTQITGNSISAQRDGIYFEFVTHSVITNNVSTRNLRYGLHFMFSDSCTYRDNAFEQNGAGVAVMYTSHIEMMNNQFSSNWGGASYGLLLKDIKDSDIRGNRFFRNSTGIHMEGTNRVKVATNLFIENGYAMKVMADCVDNLITRNSFVANSFQVATNSRQNNSVFSENYWSVYRGYDLDGDGIGDIPFRPVNLYTLVVESHPPTLILLNSLLVDVIDLAERLVPSLTPAALVDARPLMRPPI